MTATPSTMRDLKTELPPFRLADPFGKTVSDRDFQAAPALLVAFLCPHCPYVKHVRAELGRFANEYQAKGLAVVGINSNDVGQHAEDGPDGMKSEIADAGYTFPYLIDDTQQVAKAFEAACTPDFFLYDRDRRLVYRGQFDDSRPGKSMPVTGADLRAAVDAALAGRPVTPAQRPSLGCNIKWMRGNEPGTLVTRSGGSGRAGEAGRSGALAARARRATIFALAMVALASVAHAADRQWQMGVWAKPTIAPKGSTPYRNYTIDAEKFTLDIQETITKGQNALPSAPGTPVTFAIDGDMVFVKDGDAERPLRLIQQLLKLKTYSAPGGGHYIKAISDGGLQLTLEDNSVWEIDPRGQYLTQAWQVDQGISVRLIPQNHGFNYEIGDIDADVAAFGRLK